jgi:hypothetical protein
MKKKKKAISVIIPMRTINPQQAFLLLCDITDSKFEGMEWTTPHALRVPGALEVRGRRTRPVVG